MNRPIKFRAWDYASQQMLMIDLTEKELHQSRFNSAILSDSIRDNMPLMPFTDRKDQNGKEIYEGDYWEYDDGDVMTICEIIFDEGGWHAIRSEDGADMIEYYEMDILPEGQVIGNVFESPEILDSYT